MPITLKKTGRGLFETLKEASDSSGQLSSPTSPLTAKTVGANPDQAKMAGTPAQESRAQRDIASGMNLRDTLRTDQGEKQLGAGEAEKEERAKGLSPNLTGLHDRLQALSLKMQSDAANGPVAPPKVTVTQVAPLLSSGNADEATGAINNLINKTSSNPMEDAATVAKSLGLSPPKDQASVPTFLQSVEESLKKILPDQATVIKDAISSSIGDYDKITLSDVFNSDPSGAKQFLGSLSDLSFSLGMPVEEVGKLSIPQLKSKMEEVGAKDFGYVGDLQRKINDPYTSSPEREAALRELRRLGAAGVRASEADFRNVRKSLNDRVTFNGKEMSLEEALSDANISSSIDSYLKGDDNYKAEFLKNNPGLAQAIEKHKTALEAASKNLSDETKKLGEKSVATRGAATIRGVELPDSVMKVLIPAWGSYGAEVTPEARTALDKLGRLDAGSLQTISGNMSSGNMTAHDLNVLLSQDVKEQTSLLSNPEAMTDWLSYSKKWEDVSHMSPEDAVRNLLGTDLTPYMYAGDYFSDVVDNNHDFVLDSPESIMKHLSYGHEAQPFTNFSKIASGSLEGGKVKKAELDKLSSISPISLGGGLSLPLGNLFPADVAKNLGIDPGWLGDGKLGAAEMNELWTNQRSLFDAIMKSPEASSIVEDKNFWANKKDPPTPAGVAKNLGIDPGWLGDGKLGAAEMNELWTNQRSLFDAIMKSPEASSIVEDKNFWANKKDPPKPKPSGGGTLTPKSKTPVVTKNKKAK
jgi:hypothetical protein